MTPDIAEEIARMAIDTISDSLTEHDIGRHLDRDFFSTAKRDVQRGVMEVWAEWEEAQND